jgi:hypothetical protein
MTLSSPFEGTFIVLGLMKCASDSMRSKFVVIKVSAIEVGYWSGRLAGRKGKVGPSKKKRLDIAFEDKIDNR